MTKTSIPKSKAKTAYGLLSEVRRAILAEPLRYRQEWWISKEHGPSAFNWETPPKGYPSCGTVACVAGWVVSLKRKRLKDPNDAEAIAQRILGLDYDQAEPFFNAGAVRGESQTEAHARNGAAHIARFQKRYAAQLKARRV